MSAQSGAGGTGALRPAGDHRSGEPIAISTYVSCTTTHVCRVMYWYAVNYCLPTSGARVLKF